MKYLILLPIIFYSFVNNSDRVDLKVTVTNLNTLKGNIQIGLYNNPNSFPEKTKEFKAYSKAVTNNTMTIVLKDLIKDDYAISLYHDINSDGKCNLNFLGIPIEPYGFSKNFKPVLSKPSFNDCKIELDKNMTIVIKLID